MYKCIEELMLSEFTIDLLAIWAALRAKYRIRPLRLAAAASLGSLLTGFCSVYSLSGAASAAIALAAAPLLTLIAAGRLRLPQLAGAASALLSISALMSAIIHIMRIPTVITATLAAIIGATLLGRRRRWLESYELPICIEYAGCNLRLNGTIDTGNRLTEPISGLPVIVASYALLKDILPLDFDPALAHTSLPKGFRLVGYGSLGGIGCLGCFMPDRLIIPRGKRTQATDGFWIAVYPGAIPGGHDALLHPALIESLQSK